jgi:GxxExxY protein
LDFPARICLISVFSFWEKNMAIDELTFAIIGAAMKVHRALGPGLLESAYEACLAHELEQLGLRLERQKPIPVAYEGVKLYCGFRADLLVEGQIVVECKAKETLHPIDGAQALSHLRLLNVQVGLLINFHVLDLKEGIKRFVNRYQECNANQEISAD